MAPFTIDTTMMVGAAASFFVGAIPFGYLLVRFVLKKDIKKEGSGNIGATNVARVAGKKLGILTLILDIIKGMACVITAISVALPAGHAAVFGLFAFLGHCFTPWLKFNGGKGVATGLGVMLLLVPSAALSGLAAFLVVYLAQKKVSLGSLAGAITAVTVTWDSNNPLATQICVSLLVLILIFRHKSNISRLMQRKELSISPWDLLLQLKRWPGAIHLEAPEHQHVAVLVAAPRAARPSCTRKPTPSAAGRAARRSRGS